MFSCLSRQQVAKPSADVFLTFLLKGCLTVWHSLWKISRKSNCVLQWKNCFAYFFNAAQEINSCSDDLLFAFNANFCLRSALTTRRMRQSCNRQPSAVQRQQQQQQVPICSREPAAVCSRAPAAVAPAAAPIQASHFHNFQRCLHFCGIEYIRI